jgi:signal transduction histidine kinase/CheY-like chemotaxis protein
MSATGSEGEGAVDQESFEVFLVEDDRDVAEVVRAALESEGHWVRVEVNGHVASRILRQYRPDVLLLDLMIPQLDGLELCRRLRTVNAAEPYLPILMLTALDTQDMRNLGFERGADDYITKPFDITELVARVRVWGRASRRIREQHALREQNRQLQATIEREWAPLAAVLAGMSDGVLVLDGAHQVCYCNAQAGNLLGVEASSLIGQGVETIISQLKRSLAEPHVARAIWNSVVTNPWEHPSEEISLIAPTPRVILLSAFSVADAVGEKLGLLLRDVTDSKVRAILEERERIAMDLHDGAIQSLYGVRLSLAALERTLEGPTATVHIALHQQIGRIKLIGQEIRRYICNLRPLCSCDGALRAGLATILDELLTDSLIQARLELDPDVENCLDSDAAANLLYIVREATSNVIRHAAGANMVVIRLARADGRLLVTICDDGRKFLPRMSRARSGQGLRNMVKRAGALGGRLTIGHQVGRGTEVRVEIPLREEDATNGRIVRVAAISR